MLNQRLGGNIWVNGLEIVFGRITYPKFRKSRSYTTRSLFYPNIHTGADNFCLPFYDLGPKTEYSSVRQKDLAIKGPKNSIYFPNNLEYNCSEKHYR
jgi:hypothetical protein